MFRFILVLLLAGALSSPLMAQIRCDGAGCSELPFSDAQLGEFYYHFKSQYADRVFEDMAEAAALANLMGPPIGTINLHRITFGAYLGAGYVPEEKVNVYMPGVTTLQDLSALGVAINPRYFIGINLGWLAGADYAPYSGRTVSFLSPARFDLYLVGAELSESESGEKVQGKIDASSFSRGAELRYHLVEGNEVLWGPFLRFRGASVGIGHHFSLQQINYVANPAKLNLANENGVNLIWDGSNLINYDVRMRTTKLEFRTGIQLLYLFNLTVGAGGSINEGKADFLLARSGRVYADTNVNALLSNPDYAEYIKNLSEEEYQQLFGQSLPDAFMTIAVTGRGRPPYKMVYGLVGFEINLDSLKISLEAVKTQRGTFGASAGLRFDF